MTLLQGAFMVDKRYRDAMADYDIALQACSNANNESSKWNGVDAAHGQMSKTLQSCREAAAQALEKEVSAAQDLLMEELAQDQKNDKAAEEKRRRKKAKRLDRLKKDKQNWQQRWHLRRETLQ